MYIIQPHRGCSQQSKKRDINKIYALQHGRLLSPSIVRRAGNSAGRRWSLFGGKELRGCATWALLRAYPQIGFSGIAPDFELAMAVTIEQNRKRSSATLRILRLRSGQRRPKGGCEHQSFICG
jgi:hypothetical protein